MFVKLAGSEVAHQPNPKLLRASAAVFPPVPPREIGISPELSTKPTFYRLLLGGLADNVT